MAQKEKGLILRNAPLLFAVAKAKGIDLGDDYVAKHGDFYGGIPPDTKSSMLMDLAASS